MKQGNIGLHTWAPLQAMILCIIPSSGLVAPVTVRSALTFIPSFDIGSTRSRVGCVRKRRVVDRRGHVDVHATKEIDQLLEPVEVQREPVVHLHAEQAGHAPPQRVRAFGLPE